jgi:hypothetical protein
MTAANLAVFVGCTGDLHTAEVHPARRDTDMVVRVRILDARRVWNRTDYLVTPVAGRGQQWIAANRVDDLTTPGGPS